MKIFLHVEKSEIVQKVTNRILSDLGYVVVESSEGKDALEKCRYNLPDFVLLNRNISDISAIDFITEFNRIEDADTVKVIYSLNEISIPEMTKVKRAGVDDFLLKPFNREILTAKLNAWTTPVAQNGFAA